MGEKLTAKFSQDSQPDLGINIFRVEKGSVIKERKEGKPGWEYKIQFIQEGGGADGARHFESYFTKQNDGKVNVFALNLMFGLLVKLGLYKETDDVDSDMFESETFAKKWELIGNKLRKVGIDLALKKDRIVPKEFLTVEEAKEKMLKRGTVKVAQKAPEPAPAAKVEEVKAAEGEDW